MGMDPPDDDIQFDFFDEEPPTAEAAAQPRVRLPQRASRRARAATAAGGPPHSLAPLVRLAFVIFVVIFIVLLFALLISSCAGQSKHDLYGNYMDKVNTIALQSTSDGKQTISALTTPGLTPKAIAGKLGNVATEEQQNVAAAQKLSPPGKLRNEDANLVQSLQLRESGVSGLAQAFAQSTSKTKASVEALDIVKQTYRLLASDVTWDDLFQAPSVTVLTNEGVRGVTVPSSHFLAEPDLVITEHAVAALLARINNTQGSTSTTPAGLHGTNIVSTAALPNGTGGTSEVLSTSSLNTVTTSSSLVFQVTIHNGGISQEVQIPVTLVINRPPPKGPITKTEKVQLIDPGQDQTVTFSDLEGVPFASQTKITVDVAKVPYELNLSNNSASYQVIFSLP